MDEKEKIKQLGVEAQKALNASRALYSEWKGKEGEMPADVRKQIDDLQEEVITKTEQISRLQRVSAGAALLTDPAAPPLPVGDGSKGDEGDDEEEFTPFQKLMRGEQGTKTINARVTRKIYREVMRRLKAEAGGAERKALVTNDLTLGGSLVGPQQFVAELIQKVHDMVIIESLATVFTVTHAQSLGAPSLDATFNDADWTTDVATVGEDTALRTGKRELNPSQLSKLVKISINLTRMAAVDPEQLVRDELAYKFAVTKEKGFMTGTGVNQPLGLFTASAQGLSTGVDFTAANTTKLVAADMIGAKMALKAQYWTRPSTAWILHRLVLKTLMVEQATTGQYIFQTSIAGATPATILDVPYKISEYAPSTLTTGRYVAILGDMKFYWIANSLEFMLQVLNELYAANSQIGYIARLWSDGMPVLEEPFSRVKLA